MEKNIGEDTQAAFLFNVAIMKMIFDTSEKEILKASIIEQLVTAKMIHFVMQDVITPKFLKLNPSKSNEVKQEKSGFDEYDEENGYNEVDYDNENIWKVCRDNVDRVVKLCIKGFNDSLSNCMKSDIISLLGHLAFEIKTINEK